jgi:hypothetical protein
MLISQLTDSKVVDKKIRYDLFNHIRQGLVARVSIKKV